MSFGVKNFCCTLSSVLFTMAAMSAVTAAQTGSLMMYVRTAFYGFLGLSVITAVLVRM